MNAIRVSAAPFAWAPPQRGIGAMLILFRRKAALVRVKLLEATARKRRHSPEQSEEPEPADRPVNDYWNDALFWMCMMPH